MEAALAWPGAAAATSLSHLALPPALNPTWDTAEPHPPQRGASGSLQHPPRPLAPPGTAATQPAPASAPAPGKASAAAPAPDAVLDLGGHALGPVVLAALLHRAGAAQRLGPPLRLINLTSCGAGVGGVAALASMAGAAGGMRGLKVSPSH